MHLLLFAGLLAGHSIGYRGLSILSSKYGIDSYIAAAAFFVDFISTPCSTMTKMEPLERTISSDSVRSGHHLSAASSIASRKGRFADVDTASPDVERASLSMPPPASKLNLPARHPTSRRSSRISEPGLLRMPEDDRIANSTGSVAVDDTEDVTPTPKLDGMRKGNVSPSGSLPDAAMPSGVRRSEPDLEANRMSFSSLYNFGTSVFNTARSAYTSAPSSVTGSDTDGARR